MKYFPLTRSMLALALLGSMQSAHAQRTLSRKELGQLVRTAHTEEQYRCLEEHYHQESEHFKALEHREALEMERIQARNYQSSKYPEAVASARNLHMYYEQRERNAAALEGFYREKRHDAAKDTISSPSTSY